MIQYIYTYIYYIQDCVVLSLNDEREKNCCKKLKIEVKKE